jgi:hypothetical protein
LRRDKIGAKLSNGNGAEFEGNVTDVMDTYIVVKFDAQMDKL